MKTINMIISIFLLFTILSFNKSENTINQNLIGVWVYESHQDKKMKLKKRFKFKRNQFGVEFKKNGKLIRRQNVGWCGTPPITYGNVDGTWKANNDSLVTIKYEYWGGESEEDWKILYVDKKELKINLVRRKSLEKE